MPPQCDGKPKNSEKGNKLAPLSLNNLTGAFIVLLVGLSLSLEGKGSMQCNTFLCENIHFRK
jgi:hypothetical protein